MKRFLIYAIPILPLALFVAWQQDLLNRPLNPKNLSGNTCPGRELCVSVYMAPWCPHCKSALPTVQALLSKSRNHKDIGMKVVIGMGEPVENKAMAGAIAEGVILDDDKSIARAQKVNSVPSYQVLDKEGTIFLDGQEAREWINDKLGG